MIATITPIVLLVLEVLGAVTALLYIIYELKKI